MACICTFFQLFTLHQQTEIFDHYLPKHLDALPLYEHPECSSNLQISCEMSRQVTLDQVEFWQQHHQQIEAH
jgi:hypothetical protein